MSLASVLSVIGATSVGLLLSSPQLLITAFQCPTSTTPVSVRGNFGTSSHTNIQPNAAGGGGDDGSNGGSSSCTGFNFDHRRSCRRRATFLRSADESSDILSSSSSSPTSLSNLSSTLTLPRHASHDGVNEIMSETEEIIRGLNEDSIKLKGEYRIAEEDEDTNDNVGVERVYSNHYVDLGKVSLF